MPCKLAQSYQHWFHLPSRQTLEPRAGIHGRLCTGFVLQGPLDWLPVYGLCDHVFRHQKSHGSFCFAPIIHDGSTPNGSGQSSPQHEWGRQECSGMYTASLG